MNIYQFNVKDQQGKDVSLENYKGKVLLIVNTATQCGLTPQYAGLQKLHETFEGEDFEILDFPCNQFLEQAPEDSQGIKGFCEQNFGLTYEQMGKLEVNGENQDPLYKYLKEEKPEDVTNEASKGLMDKLESIGEGREGSDIKWNFTKFLVDKEGNVVERFSPSVTPEELEEKIRELL